MVGAPLSLDLRFCGAGAPRPQPHPVGAAATPSSPRLKAGLDYQPPSP